MKHAERELAARNLLSARGWISCYIPSGMGNELSDNCVINGVTAGNLLGAMEKIDNALELLGHIGGGSCKKTRAPKTKMKVKKTSKKKVFKKKKRTIRKKT